MRVSVVCLLSLLTGLGFVTAASADPLVAAVLPASRATQVGVPVTAFATMINSSGGPLSGCTVTTPIAGLTLDYQATDPATNRPVGTADQPFSMATGATQTLVLTLTPTQLLSATDVPFSFACGADTAASIAGLDTLLLTAEATQPPDIVALAVTPSNDGVVRMSSNTASQAFAVATVNLGTAASITASTDLGDLTLPVSVTICQTNPATSACLAAPSSTVIATIAHNATPTFGIFVQAQGPLPFNPQTVRITVQFQDAGGITRGATSVAATTDPVLAAGKTAGGIYVGKLDVTSGTEIGQTFDALALVGEDGTFIAYGTDGTTLSTTVTPQSNMAFAATSLLDAPLGVTLASGQDTPVFSGAASPGQWLSGSFSTTGHGGLFNVNYEAGLYAKVVTTSLLTGTWNVRANNTDPALGTVTVKADGTFTGTNVAGCSVSGSLALVDSRYNMLRLSVTVGNCDNIYLAGVRTGLAALSDTQTANDTITMVAMNAQQPLAWFLTRY